MRKFQIFSDGACDIGTKNQEKYGIGLVPFYVSLDHETYRKEVVELPLDDYYKVLTEGKCYPKTSLPSVQDYMDAFLPALQADKDIICLTISTTLSSSLQAAMTAKQMLEEDFPEATIHIVDSQQATIGQAILVTEMGRMQQDGKSLAEALAYVEEAKITSRINFLVGDLSYLEAGGRIGKVASISGSILKIKPLITLKNGEIVASGVSRSQHKAFQKILDMTKAYFTETGEDPSDYAMATATTNDWEVLKEFTVSAKEAFPTVDFGEPYQIGATISSHTGPGTSGICFVKKYETIIK
ncbi:DegV family protein [Chakrabartyella piscis]|uniref:DegV family protein n=1 Tax=Chakrabartyella piscis TaxID=2918914 RepID=UPI002958B215|nr:DegV family protein [Chakrabartyella piscis]